MRIKYCGIYKIVSPSKKVYIGQSHNILKRFKDYKKLYNSEKQRKLYNSFKKYGVNKHKFTIICICDSSELNTMEKYYISLFQSCSDKTGLNLSTGGNNNNFGSKVSKEYVDKRKKKGMPPNALPALIEARSIPINQLDLEGIFIKKWTSITAAAKGLNCSFSGIKCCLSGYNKTAQGYKWEFADKNKVSQKTGQKPNPNFGQYYSKKITQLNSNGDILKTWNSISEASRQLKINRKTISNALTNDTFTIKLK